MESSFVNNAETLSSAVDNAFKRRRVGQGDPERRVYRLMQRLELCKFEDQDGVVTCIQQVSGSYQQEAQQAEQEYLGVLLGAVKFAAGLSGRKSLVVLGQGASLSSELELNAAVAAVFDSPYTGLAEGNDYGFDQVVLSALEHGVVLHFVSAPPAGRGSLGAGAVGRADIGVDPIELAHRIRCPVLGIFGNEDANPTPVDVDDYEAALAAAAVPREFHRYDGAGHGFQDFSNRQLEASVQAQLERRQLGEQFRVLDAIAPGRIDLGLGRAPGSDGKTAFALHPLANQRAEQFPADVRDLDAWVHGEALVDNHPFAALKAYPQGPAAPQVWMLGSSLYGAQLAAVLGLPYCFAWFITDGHGCAEALAQYRKNYRPSERWPEPHVAICLWALAADTEEDAQHHFTPRARWKLYRDRGIYGPLERPGDAAAHSYTDKDAGILEELRRESFVGTGAGVAARIRATAEEEGADEVAIVTWAHDEAVRCRSYELLAAEFGLGGT